MIKIEEERESNIPLNLLGTVPFSTTWNIGRWYFFGIFFQEHLDKAIQLLPEEPFLYYLKGRYCYSVSWMPLSLNLIWIYCDCIIYFQWHTHSFIVLPNVYCGGKWKNQYMFCEFIIYICLHVYVYFFLYYLSISPWSCHTVSLCAVSESSATYWNLCCIGAYSVLWEDCCHSSEFTEPELCAH